MFPFLDRLFKFLQSSNFQNIYKTIFGTPQFPFWFLIQAFWECYIIKRSQTSNSNLKKTGKKKKTENKIKNRDEDTKISENNDENSNIKNTENLNSDSSNQNIDNSDKNINNKEINNKENEASKYKSSFKRIFDIILCYILCFTMNFFQRELFALFFKMSSPIKKNPKLIIIFTSVFLIVFCFPFDIIFKVIHFKSFAFILGFVQGLNQIRFFKLTLRHANKSLSPIQYVPIIAGFFVFDSFIGFFFGPLFNRQGRRTKVSNGNTIFNNIVFCIIYLVLTVRNNFSRDFLKGIKLNEMHATFYFAIILGFYNAINAIRNDHKVRIQKDIKKSKKSKK